MPGTANQLASNPMKNDIHRLFAELNGSRDLLAQLTIQHLILRYRRNVLGFLWTLLNPLLMMSIMAVVFSSIFGTDLSTFTVFLFSGMVPWNFFNMAVGQSGNSLIANEALIRKIYIPKLIFPFSTTLALLVESVLAFIVLFGIIIAIGGSLSWTLLFTPVAYMLLFIFTLGLSIIVSIATVFFRDLQHVITIALQGLFFATPILYGPERLKGELKWLVSINPVTPFIELFRSPLYEQALPQPGTLLQASALALCSLLAGLFIYIRLHKKIVFRL